MQEKAKGDKQVLGFTPIAGSEYGGWGFNIRDPYWNTANVTSPSNTTLNYSKTAPFFNDGWALMDNGLGGSTPGIIPQTADFRALFSDPLGGMLYLPEYLHARFLAETIPALSLPAGANNITTIPETSNPNDSSNRNFNMPAIFVPNTSSWPRQPVIGGVPDWHHSDIRVVAYPYLYPLYDKLIEISNQ